MITLIGLLVTIGIGSSFSTIPILALLYVPLCQRMGFSLSATILLMSSAAALGDAGSPASDSTLGPTAGLNADGQHNHIWDTCVPTFIHFNIPLMLSRFRLWPSRTTFLMAEGFIIMGNYLTLYIFRQMPIVHIK